MNQTQICHFQAGCLITRPSRQWWMEKISLFCIVTIIKVPVSNLPCDCQKDLVFFLTPWPRKRILIFLISALAAMHLRTNMFVYALHYCTSYWFDTRCLCLVSLPGILFKSNKPRTLCGPHTLFSIRKCVSDSHAACVPTVSIISSNDCISGMSSKWNMLNCVEHIQISKYEIKDTQNSTCVQPVMLKHPAKQLRRIKKNNTNNCTSSPWYVPIKHKNRISV